MFAFYLEISWVVFGELAEYASGTVVVIHSVDFIIQMNIYVCNFRAQEKR